LNLQDESKLHVRRIQVKKVMVSAGMCLALAAAALFAVAVPAAAQNEGESLFKSKCAMCHGADGKGDTSMGKMLKIRDLGSAEVQKQTDSELAKIVSDGKGKMPAYKSQLSEAQIKHVVEFIRTLKGK